MSEMKNKITEAWNKSNYAKQHNFVLIDVEERLHDVDGLAILFLNSEGKKSSLYLDKKDAENHFLSNPDLVLSSMRTL